MPYVTCDLIEPNGRRRYVVDLVYESLDDAQRRASPGWQCPLATPMVIEWPDDVEPPPTSDPERHRYPYLDDADLERVGARLLHGA